MTLGTVPGLRRIGQQGVDVGAVAVVGRKSFFHDLSGGVGWDDGDDLAAFHLIALQKFRPALELRRLPGRRRRRLTLGHTHRIRARSQRLAIGLHRLPNANGPNHGRRGRHR